MVIKVKKLAYNAQIPQYAHFGDAGLDLVATSYGQYDADKDIYTYQTGIAIEIPPGYVGLLVPRSSVYKTGFSLANNCGIIDENYRGEIMFKFRKVNPEQPDFQIGDRIGQLVIVPYLYSPIVEVDELSETNRGTSGWGSTGN